MLLITTEANTWVPAPSGPNPCSTVRRQLLAFGERYLGGDSGELRYRSKAPPVPSNRVGPRSQVV